MTNHNNKIINHHHKNHNLLPPPPPPGTTARSNSTIQACAACRYQRRKCAPDCILAPYFPHDRQRQFQNAHKLFGVSNITKIIRNLDRPQKDEAMRTIIYQSDVRSIDPVGGCYRIIRELQRQIEISCAELEFVLQQLALYRTLSVQNNNQTHPQFNHDLIVIDEIDYDIHLVNNPDEPQMYGDPSDNNHVAPPVNSWSVVNDNSPSPVSQPPMHASICDDFKSLLINEVVPPGSGQRGEFKFNEANDQSSEKSLFEDESKKGLIKVENVCYNEQQHYHEILTDHKAIRVDGE